MRNEGAAGAEMAANQAGRLAAIARRTGANLAMLRVHGAAPSETLSSSRRSRSSNRNRRRNCRPVASEFPLSNFLREARFFCTGLRIAVPPRWTQARRACPAAGPTANSTNRRSHPCRKGMQRPTARGNGRSRAFLPKDAWTKSEDQLKSRRSPQPIPRAFVVLRRRVRISVPAARAETLRRGTLPHSTLGEVFAVVKKPRPAGQSAAARPFPRCVRPRLWGLGIPRGSTLLRPLFVPLEFSVAPS